MFRNYALIAFRHFTKHKLFSAINIFCLSIGITFSMIIGVYVLDQQRINSTLRHADRQYYIKTAWKEKGLGSEIVSISPWAKTIKEEYPALVANYFRYNPVTNVVSSGNLHFKEDIAICDTTLVSMYDFPLLHGDKNHAFTSNNAAVITAQFAKKLFGTTNAIGKTLSIQTTVAGTSQDYMVSAVLKNLPYNSVTHLLKDEYSVYVPTTGNRYYNSGDPSLSWDNVSMLSFIELKPGVHVQAVNAALNQLIKKYSSDFIWKNLWANTVPVKDYYLNDNNAAVKKMTTILSTIAMFILLMVIINYVNINIGTSAYRLKEIGLRKTFGSAKRQVVLQFLLEALILTFMAALFSLLFYQLLTPVFSKVLNTTLKPVWNFSAAECMQLLGLVTAIGLLAGAYPAFVLSSTHLIQAVKGKIDSSKGGRGLKRALVVVQFSLAILVFICALNLSKQVTYLFHKDLGYNKEQILVISAFPKQWDSAGVLKMQTIKNALLLVPHVQNVTVAFDLPESTPFGRIILFPPGSTGTKKQLNLPISNADEDYAKTFGIKMKAGTFFDPSGGGLVLNETAVKELGLTNTNAVGQQIETPGGPATISGVIGDYNFSSMQDKIGPLGFGNLKYAKAYRYMAVKLNTSNITATLDDIKAQWHTLSPNAPFDYSFMDDRFEAMYQSELQLKTAADVATVLNLIIVLLGVLGVIVFTLNKRMKEIAVRKVLGANVGSIVMLFLQEYAWLIVIANIIAWPLAYMCTEHFLQNFAYRVQQNMAPYLLVLVSVAAMAFTLISIHCTKAAIASPVKSLKAE
ncbi:MacB-like core domain-containing protein [Filimonas lacunae]|uniref:MacB-like core domain-containing protein n=1 Tax=Filimonas lacunae TaxID=477680 RepID=A0A173MA30_9BACT|nr:ABC transporter permease [Filimonas lacunae]BAV04382.1 ABC transporter, permease protein [Filimonas lacunae]SIT31230.1 MacB-like core domain-containing protein [Filimonas lacunae]